MHLRVLVNGTIDFVQKWKNDLASVWLPYEHTPGQKGAFQLGVRTIEMIDLCFPEDQLDNVLQMVQPNTDMYHSIDGKKRKRYPWLDRFIKWTRKAMKLIEIPKIEYKPNLMKKDHIAVHGIGIKQDLYDENGIELL